MIIELEEVHFATASYPKATLDGELVPIAVLDGKPWFSTAHIQHALNGRFDPIACAKFTSAHVGAHRFPFDPDDDLSHVISTFAARTLAEDRLTRRANRKLRGWLIQQDRRLRTDTIGASEALSGAAAPPR